MSFKYVRNVMDAIPGAPFPTNLRKHRRGRHHHNFRNPHPHPQGYTVTEDDLSRRDPIILTTKDDFSISQAGKEVMRLGPKFCPTPKGSVDEFCQNKSWLKWRENSRRAWFHNKSIQVHSLCVDSRPGDRLRLIFC